MHRYSWRSIRGRIAKSALCIHLAHVARMTRWRTAPGRHDLRGRGAVALRRLVTMLRCLVGEVDLRGSAAELLAEMGRVTGRRIDLNVQAARRGLRLGASLSPLFRRDGARWRIPLREAWLKGATDIAVSGRPCDGRAIGAAVARWASPDSSVARPVLAEWRRRLIRPDPAVRRTDTYCRAWRVRERQAGERGLIPEHFGGTRRTVELLAEYPTAAEGETAWQAARSLLTAAGQLADHATVKRTARGLEFLRAHGHLDTGNWRPAADLDPHPALQPGEGDSADLAHPSATMVRYLARLCVAHPEQLSRREAQRVARRRRLRWRDGMTELERLVWLEGQEHDTTHHIDPELGDWLAV